MRQRAAATSTRGAQVRNARYKQYLPFLALPEGRGAKLTATGRAIEVQGKTAGALAKALHTMHFGNLLLQGRMFCADLILREEDGEKHDMLTE